MRPAAAAAAAAATSQEDRHDSISKSLGGVGGREKFPC